MNELDVYYRALLSYRALTRDNREIALFKRAISQTDTEDDNIVITRNICTVEEDWIDEIEKGLIFIEKAIKEERQFIYSNGEVVEIEKVKNVSKDSVQHLARHSNLITKEQKGEDFIPDKLYSVERLNDYAVYENRFLYMLLCYLKDFITIRYNKILDLSNKYDGKMILNKSVTLAKQKVTYKLELHDERKDDEYLREHNSARDVIDRIDLMLKTVMAFLATPLMEIAGKAPLLKPPITKTNVLKMDNNFKGAVALYDYIIAYDKPGFVCEQQVTELAPFSEAVSDDVAESVAFTNFLVYSYGLGLTTTLKSNYDIEEAKRKELEIQKRKEQLEALKRRLASMQEDPNEYIIALEKQVKSMETDNRQIIPLKEEIGRLKETGEELASELKKSHDETDSIRKELSEVEDKHRDELNAVKAECDDRIHENIVKHEGEMRALEKTCSDRIEKINLQTREAIDKLNGQINEINQSLTESRNEFEELMTTYNSLLEEKRICEARIKALCSINGEAASENQYTEKEEFDELEREFEAFNRFYKSKWNGAKKNIRKKLLSFESLKGNKGQD